MDTLRDGHFTLSTATLELALEHSRCMMGQFQSGSGSGIASSWSASGSHCYRLMVHIDVPLGSPPRWQAEAARSNRAGRVVSDRVVDVAVDDAV